MIRSSPLILIIPYRVVRCHPFHPDQDFTFNKPREPYRKNPFVDPPPTTLPRRSIASAPWIPWFVRADRAAPLLYFDDTVSREMLLAYCRFAEKHDLHLISDEVYALSVFENDREYGVIV